MNQPIRAVQSPYYYGDSSFRTPPPDLPSLLLKERIIYLGLPLVSSDDFKRQLGVDVTKLIIAQLLYLQFADPEKPIYFYINSTGTSWYTGDVIGYETEAFAICDTISYVKPPVHTICIGQAMGTAAMILSAGTKGFRASLPHATVVLNQPRTGAQGQATDIQIRAKEVLANKAALLDILSKNTGQSLDKLAKDSDRMLYLTPEEAKSYGIIDRVLESSKDLPKPVPAFSAALWTGITFFLVIILSTNHYPIDTMDEIIRVPYTIPGSPYWQWVSIYTRLNQERILFLTQPLTSGVANSLVSALLYLDSEDQSKPIYLYINSSGDPVASGMTNESAGMMGIGATLAIYDTIQHIKSPVITISMGQAIGLAALILSSGAPGKRGSLPHTMIALSQPRAGARGQATDIQINAAEVLEKRSILLEIFAKNTGQSPTRLAKDIDRTFYLTPDGAKEYGLIDVVLNQLPASQTAIAPGK